jgi:hypothetical protein
MSIATEGQRFSDKLLELLADIGAGDYRRFAGWPVELKLQDTGLYILQRYVTPEDVLCASWLDKQAIKAPRERSLPEAGKDYLVQLVEERSGQPYAALYAQVCT